MSEFWKRKVRKYFSIFDFDKDGLISKADFVGMATRFAKFEKADKEKTERLETQFDNLWEQFMKKADTADKNILTAEVLTDSIARQLYDPELMKRITDLVECIFDLMDLNRDGYLQEDEFKRYFAQLGVQDESLEKEAFKAIDVNGDGKLSMTEFLNAFFDFFFSDNEKSPNRHFFGRFVD